MNAHTYHGTMWNETIDNQAWPIEQGVDVMWCLHKNKQIKQAHFIYCFGLRV